MTLENFLIDEETSLGIKDIIKKLGLTKQDLHRIRKLHKERDQIIARISTTRNKKELLRLSVMADLIDTLLQRAWKATDIKPHKFWKLPKCLCGYDNETSWPEGPFNHNMICPLHNDRSLY